MLPVAERELRVASRHPKTYRSRSITALAMLLCASMAFWLLETWGSAFLSGPDMFNGLSIAAMVYYVFSGAANTADCLSDEKREGTLGLLFLTDLKGYDVVLGKLLATSLHTFFGFLTTLPLFAIVFMLGGVKLGEFWRIMLNLGATLFLALSVGLFVSSLSRQNRRALSATSSILFILMFVFPGLAELIRRNGWSPELAGYLQFLSPLNTHYMALEAASALRSNFYWWSVLTTLLLAAGLLSLASIILPRAWQDQPATETKKFGKGWRGLWQQIKLGPKSARRSSRIQRLGGNPFYWLASRERFGTLPLWIFIISVVVAMRGIYWRYSASDPNFAAAMCVAGCMALAVSIFINFTSTACQRLAEDRRDGTLEVLLSTPLSVKSILRGQWLALVRQFAGPAAVVVLIDSIVYWIAMPEFGLPPHDVRSIYVGSICLMLALAQLVALGWAGMWMALRVKKPTHASGAAFWRVILLPWLVVCMVLLGFAWARGPSYLESGFPYLVPLTIISVILLNCLGWSIWCRSKLYHEFRTAATDRFQPPKPPGALWRMLSTAAASVHRTLSTDLRTGYFRAR